MPISSVTGAGGPNAPISVVIPFYRDQARLRRALRSVECQTLQPCEVVLVDDGSPEPLPSDATHLTVPVRVVSHDRNRGIPAARNSGVQAARGEWIAFLDQDDQWAPHKLARQWRCLQNEPDPQRTVVFGRCLVAPEGNAPQGWVFPSTAAVARLHQNRRNCARELMLRGNIVPFVTLLVHQSVWRRYGALDENLRGGSDDFELVLRLAAEGLRFRCADFPAAPARYSAIHYLTGQNFSDPEKFFADEVALLRDLCGRYPALTPLHDRSLARTHYRLARSYDVGGAPQRALAHHQRARSLDPFWLAPRIAVALHHAPPPLSGWLAAGRRIARWLRGGA